jgi:hypothetical protein
MLRGIDLQRIAVTDLVRTGKHSPPQALSLVRTGSPRTVLSDVSRVVSGVSEALYHTIPRGGHPSAGWADTALRMPGTGGDRYDIDRADLVLSWAGDALTGATDRMSPALATAYAGLRAYDTTSAALAGVPGPHLTNDPLTRAVHSYGRLLLASRAGRAAVAAERTAEQAGRAVLAFRAAAREHLAEAARARGGSYPDAGRLAADRAQLACDTAESLGYLLPGVPQESRSARAAAAGACAEAAVATARSIAACHRPAPRDGHADLELVRALCEMRR